MRATLTYHSIDASDSPVSVSPPAFDRHLAWLTSGAVRVMPLDALVGLPHAAEDAVAVTFDDGFRNVRRPVERLRAHGIPVTIFIVTAEVGRTNAWGGRSHPSVPTLPLLDWTEIEQLASIGVTFEAHTRTHAPLSRLSDDALAEEIGGCQEDLNSRLGVRSSHLAYPYGDVDTRVSALAAARYRCGHTTELRVLAPGDQPMRLPRLDMYYWRSAGALEAWGRPEFAATLSWIGARRLLRHAIIGGPFPGAPRRWTR